MRLHAVVSLRPGVSRVRGYSGEGKRSKLERFDSENCGMAIADSDVTVEQCPGEGHSEQDGGGDSVHHAGADELEDSDPGMRQALLVSSGDEP